MQLMRATDAATDSPYPTKPNRTDRPNRPDQAMVDFNDEPWQCPAHGWAVKFDDLALPFWNWTKLEKFWVDANFFHGSIPGSIAARWPMLRSLDLYNNDLTGR